VSALIICPAARPVQQADGSPPAVVRGAGGADAAAVTSCVSARKALAADEEGEPAEGKYLCVFQGQWTTFDPLFCVSWLRNPLEFMN